LQKLREEDGLNLDGEDDNAVWQGWDIESNDSDEDSDEDEDWINVDDVEDEPLVISDSEDENENDRATPSHESPNPPRISTLATSKVSLQVQACLFILMYFRS
jgi:protein SDA1